MFKRFEAYFMIFLLLAVCIPRAYGQDSDLTMSLRDCIIRSLQNNLRLAVQVYNPEIAQSGVRLAKERFLPSFGLSFNTRNEENPSTWGIQGSDIIQTDSTGYSLSIDQLIPTGANLKFSLVNLSSETNQAYQLLNPYHQSTLRLDFTQPLLNGFGSKVNRYDILIAQNDLEMSRSEFELTVMDTIYNVQEAYWNCFYALENLKIKEQSLRLAQDLLEKNKKEVEVGKMAQMELLNAETVIAQREADILQAEAMIEQYQDILKDLLNLAQDNELHRGTIVLQDEPEYVAAAVQLDESLRQARQNRPDLRIQQTRISSDELSVSVARNRTLPGLDFSFSFWSPGLSGDRLLYPEDNPIEGAPIGVEEGSASDSFKDAFGLTYKNWSLGLTLTLPLGNMTSRAAHAQARLNLEKSSLELEELERRILLEVRDSVRSVNTNVKRVEAYRIARELAEQQLASEEKKMTAGLTTNYFVLEYQERLSSARSLEIQSLIDYSLALARLDRTVGVSLKKRNIQIEQLQKD